MSVKGLGAVDLRTLIGRSVRASGSDQQKTFPMSDRLECF
jgi:hypothetical protein